MFLDTSISVTKPEFDHVYQILCGKSNEWNEIGRGLKVPYDYRQGLKNMAISNKDKLEDVINKWFESESSEVTWGALLEVLRDIEFMDLVRRTQEFLRKPEVKARYRTQSTR